MKLRAANGKLQVTDGDTGTTLAAPPSRDAGSRNFANLRSAMRSWIAHLLTIAVIVVIWQLVAWLRLKDLEEGTLAYRQQQSYLPYPHRVFLAFFENFDSFFGAGVVTFWNAFLGFLIGGVVGYALALLMSRAQWVARSFYIYIIGSQMIPVIALAPILYGIIREETLLKVTVAAYLTFFPVTVNVLKGLQSVEPRALDLMQSYAASNWETYRKVRIPVSLPFLFNALKIAATGSLIGAIVSELMGGNKGIGVLIISLQYNSYGGSDKLWALVIEAALVGVIFFGLVSLAERLLVPWQPEFRRTQRTG
ncbi:MAG: ABC transporter permease [Chloroflexota bacterium]